MSAVMYNDQLWITSYISISSEGYSEQLLYIHMYNFLRPIFCLKKQVVIH